MEPAGHRDCFRAVRTIGGNVKLLAYLRSVATKLFHRSQLRDEMEEELRSHIQHRADDLERSGLRRGEAERRARIEFGGRERFKEESQEAMGGNGIESFVQDLRFTLRVLRKSPGFTVAAIVTLVLGIGANAVVFGVLNALILRPLNVPQAESLYAIERGPDKAVNHSYPDYLDLRDRNHSFESLAAYNVAPVGLDTGNNPSSAWILEVTGNYFDALGIQPYLGRFFHAADEHGANSAPYIVLTYAYWHTHFHDDRGVVLQAALGRPVKLLAFGSAAGLILGLLASQVLASIVYQATSRDPLVLAGAVLAMSLVGLLATWIPAQRALSIEPSILMREE